MLSQAQKKVVSRISPLSKHTHTNKRKKNLSKYIAKLIKQFLHYHCYVNSPWKLENVFYLKQKTAICYRNTNDLQRMC